METNSIRVGTFNLGNGFQDYRNMCSMDERELNLLNENFQSQREEDEAYQALNFQPKTKEERQSLNTVLERVDKAVIQDIWKAIEGRAAVEIIGQVDVLCLQEVRTLERPFVTALKGAGLEIEYLEGRSCGIAYDPKKVDFVSAKCFVTGKGKKIYGKEVHAAIFELKLGKKVAVASVHSPGFELFNPKIKMTNLSHFERNKRSEADAYHRKVRKFVAGLEADHVIIAGDMNNNPENHANTFNEYEQAGYRVMRTKRATCADHQGKVEGYGYRELDFMFVQEVRSVWQRLSNSLRPFFSSVLTLKSEELKIADGFAFESDKNCSDHLPLIATFRQVDVVGSKAYLAALVLLVAAVGASAVWAIRR